MVHEQVKLTQRKDIFMTKERFNRLEANHKYILDLLEVQGYLVICLGNHERKIFNSV